MSPPPYTWRTLRSKPNSVRHLFFIPADLYWAQCGAYGVNTFGATVADRPCRKCLAFAKVHDLEAQRDIETLA